MQTEPWCTNPPYLRAERLLLKIYYKIFIYLPFFFEISKNLITAADTLVEIEIDEDEAEDED